MSINEDIVEQAALAIIQELGWRYEEPFSISPDGPNRLRVSNGEVILPELLTQAAKRINPDIPDEALQAALKQVRTSESQSLIEENRRIHRLYQFQYSEVVFFIQNIKLPNMLIEVKRTFPSSSRSGSAFQNPNKC